VKFDRIETKLIILIAVALITLVAVSMVFVIYYVEGRMREDFRNKNNLELNSLAMIAGPLIYEYDFSAIERELDVIMRDEDVYYVGVVDEAGTTIRSKGTDETIARENLVEKEVDIFYEGETVGRLKMYFSLVRINEEIQKLELIMALIFVTSFLILASLTYFFSRRLIVKPINELTDGVKHISQGDFDYRIPLERKDQLGELAASFNQMAKNLEKSQGALRQSEERYRLLIENLPVGLYRSIGDPKGKFVMANPAMVRMFGYERPQEFLQTSVADLYQDPAERQGLSEKLLAQGHVLREELRLKKRDGTPIWGAVTARAVSDESSEIKYFDGMIEDITERKRAEEALQKAHQELEAKVEERTKKLKEKTEKLERMNKLFVDRELRMKELKEEIKKLKRKRQDKEVSHEEI